MRAPALAAGRRIRRARRSARGPSLCALALALSSSCTPSADAAGAGIVAEFGVFYGGQVQERDEIPFSLDVSRQRQGFRLTHTPPPAEPLEVRWELGKPGRGRRVPDSQGRRARPRAVQLGRAHFRPGEPVFEQALPFTADDPLGLWNLRVLVGERVVLERPFVVYDAAQRARRERAAAEADAGF